MSVSWYIEVSYGFSEAALSRLPRSSRHRAPPEAWTAAESRLGIESLAASGISSRRGLTQRRSSEADAKYPCVL